MLLVIEGGYILVVFFYGIYIIFYKMFNNDEIN